MLGAGTEFGAQIIRCHASDDFMASPSTLSVKSLKDLEVDLAPALELPCELWSLEQGEVVMRNAYVSEKFKVPIAWVTDVVRYERVPDGLERFALPRWEP